MATYFSVILDLFLFRCLLLMIFLSEKNICSKNHKNVLCIGIVQSDHGENSLLSFICVHLCLASLSIVYFKAYGVFFKLC